MAGSLLESGGKGCAPSFLVKNHSFVDGNSSIAAALFLWFMRRTGILYRGRRFRAADNCAGLPSR